VQKVASLSELLEKAFMCGVFYLHLHSYKSLLNFSNSVFAVSIKREVKMDG